MSPGGTVLVTDFGTDALRFPRGWLIRGFTALLEFAAGPRHSGMLSPTCRRGSDPLANAAGLVVEATRPAAGGSIVIAALRPV